MAKPTVTEHITEIRALLQETVANQFTDDEVKSALSTALGALSSFYPPLVKVSKTGLAASATVIDLSADCPASNVAEIWPASATSPITTFKIRGSDIILPSQIGQTSADFYYRGRWAHDGTNVDWYPQQFRGAVCMLSAALLIVGRMRELAETDALKANAMNPSHARLHDAAMNLFNTKPSPLNQLNNH